MTNSPSRHRARTFTASEVQAAIEAVIVYERDRTARLLAGHAAQLQAAARADQRIVTNAMSETETP